jgi:hypothetical protein
VERSTKSTPLRKTVVSFQGFRLMKNSGRKSKQQSPLSSFLLSKIVPTHLIKCNIHSYIELVMKSSGLGIATPMLVVSIVIVVIAVATISYEASTASTAQAPSTSTEWGHSSSSTSSPVSGSSPTTTTTAPQTSTTSGYGYP